MTQEDKELLLKDLCARLPYKPIVHAKWSYGETNGELKYKEADRKLEINDIYAIWDIKPYLRPMSSMTEEEKAELNAITDEFGDNWLEATTPEEKWKCTFLNSSNEIDWLNAHHFDYRDLISKGLAIEALEGMY